MLSCCCVELPLWIDRVHTWPSQFDKVRILESSAAVSAVWILFSAVNVVIIWIFDFLVLVLLSVSTFVWLQLFFGI